MSPIFPWIAAGCGALALGALAFHALSLLGAIDFLRQKSPPADAAAPPPVSILKPLKGADPQMYESFRSHCLQDYCLQNNGLQDYSLRGNGEYEIVFGVNDAADDALPYVKRLQDEFPQIPMRVIVCTKVIGANRKASNLTQMMAEAKYEHLVINDSDIRVPADYLRRVMAWFAPPLSVEFVEPGNSADRIGMVTCMYRAVAGKTLWSKVESLGVTMDFMPPVLAARYLEGRVYFGLGSTLAVTKESVRAIGGLEAIADYLADDYELGTRIADSGFKVILSDVIVDTFVSDYDWKRFLDHQLRWARTVRSSRPAGYFGIVITFGVFWSLLAMAFSECATWSVALLAANLVARLVVLQVVGIGIVGDRSAWALTWLMPLRDLLSPFIWLFGLSGSRIVWRGEVFQLHHGKLTRE